jgi:hypothetical protein
MPRLEEAELFSHSNTVAAQSRQFCFTLHLPLLRNVRFAAPPLQYGEQHNPFDTLIRHNGVILIFDA